MHTDYHDSHVCANCLKLYPMDHVNTKCLWEPTYFRPTPCILCKSIDKLLRTTGCVDDVRYFLCTTCDVQYGNPKYLNSYLSTQAERDRFNRFIRVDIRLNVWQQSHNY